MSAHRRLLALLGMRVRLAPDVAVDLEEGVLWVPRRGRLERLFARLLHRGEGRRVRLALDARGREVLSVFVPLAARDGGIEVGDLAARLGIEVPRDVAGAGEELVALLVWLDALVVGRVLVAEPI